MKKSNFLLILAVICILAGGYIMFMTIRALDNFWHYITGLTILLLGGGGFAFWSLWAKGNEDYRVDPPK